jgi:hypothetical protein
MASPRFMAFIERRMMPFSTHTAGKFCGHNIRGWFGPYKMHAKMYGIECKRIVLEILDFESLAPKISKFL